MKGRVLAARGGRWPLEFLWCSVGFEVVQEVIEGGFVGVVLFSVGEVSDVWVLFPSVVLGGDALSEESELFFVDH